MGPGFGSATKPKSGFPGGPYPSKGFSGGLSSKFKGTFFRLGIVNDLSKAKRAAAAKFLFL